MITWPLVPVDIDGDTARERAAEELSDPKYAEAQPGLLQQLLDDLLDWLGDLLDGISGAAPGGLLGSALLIVVVVAAVALVLWRTGPLRREAASTTGPVLQEGITAEGYRERAERAADRGDLTEAARERFRALITAMEERHVLDPRPGRTADEAAAELGGLFPDSAPGLIRAAGLFDDVRYGDLAADTDQYRFLVALDQHLTGLQPRWQGRVAADVG